jgi:hypothetical protein
MTIQTRAALLAVAELVRDATVPGENTALRVGGYCVDLLDSILLQSETQTPSVKCVATSNVAALSGLTTAADGITANTDGVDAILLTAQGTASQNGPWVVHAGAWTRPVWFPTGGNGGGQWVTVQQGTLYADTEWQCTTNNPSAVIGTNNLAWRRQDAVSHDSSNNLTIGGNANCANIASRCATGGYHRRYVNNTLITADSENGFFVYNPADATDYGRLISDGTYTYCYRITNSGTAHLAWAASATTVLVGDPAITTSVGQRVAAGGSFGFSVAGGTLAANGTMRFGSEPSIAGLTTAPATALMIGISGTNLQVGSNIAITNVLSYAVSQFEWTDATGALATLTSGGLSVYDATDANKSVTIEHDAITFGKNNASATVGVQAASGTDYGVDLTVCAGNSLVNTVDYPGTLYLHGGNDGVTGGGGSYTGSVIVQVWDSTGSGSWEDSLDITGAITKVRAELFTIAGYAGPSINDDGLGLVLHGGESGGGTGDGGPWTGRSGSKGASGYAGAVTLMLGDAAAGYMIRGVHDAGGYKMALYTATPVVQAADPGALTDSTGGGVDGTLVAISGSGDDANINNNFADMAAKVNAIRLLLHNLGACA